MAFYESPRFPLNPVPGLTSGPAFNTDIVKVRSGFEVRNVNWAKALRKFNVALGVKGITDIETLRDFFMVMQGRAHGFRIKDWLDYKSCGINSTISNVDQIIGTGDGTNRIFQLTKRYVAGANTHTINIKKPVVGTTIIAVNGVSSAVWTIDTTTGIVTFNVGQAPGNGLSVTAGYEYDVPARFDTDYLDVEMLLDDITQCDVPVVELRL
jgi:uncharacterized protein (TIGR02217 family)